MHIRVMASGETKRLPNTEGMAALAWSADGTAITAGKSNGRTYTGWDLSLLATPPRRSGLEWSTSDRVAFSRQGLARATQTGEVWVRLRGSAEKRIVRSDSKMLAPGGPWMGPISALTWSADGQRLFFTTGPEIHQVDVSGGTSARVATITGTDASVGALAQVRDGRLIIATMVSGVDGFQLWQLPLSLETGAATGEMRRITSATGGDPDQLSVTDDGKHVVHQHARYQTDVYIADLVTTRPHLGTLRRLTMDERNDSPFAWVPDSSAVLFTSDRNGSMDIFKQSLGSDVAEPLVTGPSIQDRPRVTSDRKWVFFVDHGTNGAFLVMRIPLEGGTPELILSNPDYAAPRCPVRGPCVLLEAHGERMTVSALDPVHGKGRELANLPNSAFGANLSPTGTEFAFVMADPEPRRRIRVVSFAGEAPRDIILPTANALSSLDWLPDGSGFLAVDKTFVHANLLLVHLDGQADSLLSVDREVILGAIPSPDGKRVALNWVTKPSDVWMLQTF